MPESAAKRRAGQGVECFRGFLGKGSEGSQPVWFRLF